MRLDYRAPRDDDRLRSPAESLAVRVSFPFLLLFMAYAFATSCAVVVGEPFYRHADWGHFFRYVIFPTAALTVCAAWAVAVTALVCRCILRPWWLLVVLLAAVPAIVLAAGIEGYLNDIIEMGSWEPMPP